MAVSIAVGTGHPYAGRTAGTYAFAGATTVAAGDILVALARSADGSQGYSSMTSTGTATVSSWTKAVDIGTTSATTRNALFTATVTAGGTVTPSITVTGGTAVPLTVSLFVITGASSVTSVNSTTARQASKAITSGSIVISSTGDWAANASTGAAFTPAGGTVVLRQTDGVDQQATAGQQFSEYVAYWTNQSAGTTTYGLSTPSAGTYNTIVVEALLAGTAAPALDPPKRLWVPGALRRGPFRGIAAMVSREAPVAAVTTVRLYRAGLTSAAAVGLPVMVSDGVGLVPGYLMVVDGTGNLIAPGGMTTV